ncbi:MAG: hypothetical protein WBG43_09655 [Marinifilaceae bacterium]
MKSKNFRRFIRKIFVLSLPFIFLVGVFIYTDPFKVINNYKEFNSDPFSLNQSYVCWQNYLNNRDSMKYDSFLLGNSCSMAYRMADWKEHIGDSQPISLMGSGESLYSINAKIKKLSSMGIPVRNIIILMDNSILKYVSKPIKHTFLLHYDITGDSKISFQSTFLQAFLNPNILIPYLDYLFFGEKKAYMNGIIGSSKVLRNKLTNDLYNPREEEIKVDSLTYYKKHACDFREVMAIDSDIVIGVKQLDMLKEIKLYIDKTGAAFKIIINPSYQQYKMSLKDLNILESVFGKTNVFDYSGTQEFSTNKGFFYESAHYRPNLGKLILREIYNQ